MGVLLPLTRVERETRGEAEMEKVAVTVAVTVTVADTEEEELRQAVALAVLLLLRVPVGEGVEEPVQVPLPVRLWLTVALWETVGEVVPRPWRPLEETLAVALAALLALALGVVLPREETVAPLALGCAVPVTVSVMVCEKPRV